MHDELGERFKTGKKLVLSGPDGGDISVALGLGCQPESIIAVDQDQAAAISAGFRFPSVKVQNRDVRAVAQEDPCGFSFIFLDLCANLTDPSIGLVADTTLVGLHDGGVLACGFFVGREMDTKGGARQRVKATTKKLLEGGLHMDDEALPYMARLTLLRDELVVLTSKQNCTLVPISAIFYRSKHDHDPKGTAMCIYIARFVQCTPASLEKEALKAMDATPEVSFYKTTESELGRYAMGLITDGFRPELLLNVSKTTVAAWKAHATRGTYK